MPNASCQINGFYNLLCSLLQFNVQVLTDGNVTFITGILTDVNSDFITVVGAQVYYIPINQIAIITRLTTAVA